MNINKITMLETSFKRENKNTLIIMLHLNMLLKIFKLFKKQNK